MDAMKLLPIMYRYNNCPNCGSDRVGNGEGVILVEDDIYTRMCKCGFEITVNKNGEEIALDNFFKKQLKKKLNNECK